MTLGLDLALDPLTRDLQLAFGDLVLSHDPAQAIWIVLSMILGECFWDQGAGVPYFTEIFVKNPNMGHVESRLREAILSVPTVTEITAFKAAFDPRTRRLTVTWAAAVGDAQLSGQVSIP